MTANAGYSLTPMTMAGGGAPAPENPWGTGTSGYGLVEAVGAGVTRFAVGDRVVGMMDIRETNVVHEDWLWDPGELDPLIALCMEPAQVSIHCVRDSNIRYGDRVAVIGLGALGLAGGEHRQSGRRGDSGRRRFPAQAAGAGRGLWR